MAVLRGVISIKDNATAVLRQVRHEQTVFRKDVEQTKKELLRTWNKQYNAKINATPAMAAMQKLRQRLDPLRKKVVTAVAIKDIATQKIRNVTNRVRAVGRMVARPVVRVAVTGMKALSSVGKGILTAGKALAIGGAVFAGAGALAAKAIFGGSTEAAKAQIEAETKLEAVLKNVVSLQKQGPEAYKKAKQELMGMASELQKIGVIGDEITLAGMQQLATFQLDQRHIGILSEGMADLLAQQKGLNASQEDAVSIANMVGKAMDGQVGALSRVGISFSEAQEKVIKTGSALERATVLAEVLKQNVGGVNKALAETDQGKIKQMENAWGDMKEEVGKAILPLKAQFASVLTKNIPVIQKLGVALVGTISKFSEVAFPIINKVISGITPIVESGLVKISSIVDGITPVLSNAFTGFGEASRKVLPIVGRMISGFQPLLPQIISFGAVIASTIGNIAVQSMPAIEGIVTSIQEVIPAILPVLQAVVTQVGNLFAMAMPVVQALVAGISIAVQALAPVVTTIFNGIAEKVGTVIAFISERMGFVTGVIEWAAPMISDILSTMWSVVGPVLDIAISVFKILWAVVEWAFPGIQKILETVWKVVKPIVEGVGTVVKGIAGAFGWVADKLTGDGGKKAGKNARGTNSWRGGPTWVGEDGPELMEVPRGARILPTKESAKLASGGSGKVIHINIPKLADNIVIREEADIDKLAKAFVREAELAAFNTA